MVVFTNFNLNMEPVIAYEWGLITWGILNILLFTGIVFLIYKFYKVLKQK